MTETACEVCNRAVEPHLTEQHKKTCFVCTTDLSVRQGAIPVFGVKNRPIEAACGVCSRVESGQGLVASPWGFICGRCAQTSSQRSHLDWLDTQQATANDWLVRSAGRVLGPFSFNEVESQIRENRISALDEISRPGRPWRLLRDEDQFRLLINEIRNRRILDKSGENTNSAVTETDLMTDTSEVHVGFGRTEKLLEGVVKATTTSTAGAVRPSESGASAASTSTETDSAGDTRDLLKSYGYAGDRKVQKQVREAASRKIWTALAVLIIASGLVLLRFGRDSLPTGEDRNRAFQDLMDKGLRAEKVGDYNSAYQSFNEAKTLRPNDSELLLHLAPLTFLIDRQLTQAGRMFQQIIDNEQGANYKKAGYLGLGLIALETHELEGAREKFMRALSLDPEYLPALANLGIVAFFQNEFGLAESSLFRALDRGCSDGAVVITMADIQMARADKENNKEKLSAAHNLLEAYLNVTVDYEQEVLVTNARVLSMMGKEGEAAQRIDRFLDTDPEQTDLHYHDWGFYRGRASWGLLAESLRKTVATLGGKPRQNAALGLAMYLSKEKLDGAQFVSQAQAQSPSDSLVQALNGWMSGKLGKREEGRAAIKEAALGNVKEKLPYILLARQCSELGDLDCAKHNWEEVLNRDSKSVAALVGLARVEWARKNTDGANRWLRQAQAHDPTYIPVLMLAQEMGGSAP